MKEGDIVVWWRPCVVQGQGPRIGVVKAIKGDLVVAVDDWGTTVTMDLATFKPEHAPRVVGRIVDGWAPHWDARLTVEHVDSGPICEPPARCRWCHETLAEHRDDGPNARMPCLGKKHGFVAEEVAGAQPAEWTCKRCGVDVAEGERDRHVCRSQNVQAHRDKRIDEIEERVRKLEEVVQP